MKIPFEPCLAYGEETSEEHRELLVDLAGLDSAIGCLDCLAGIPANLDVVEQILFCCRRLEGHLSRHLSGKEQIDLATASRISPEYAEFARDLKLEHEQLCLQLASFAKAVQEVEAADDPCEAIRRIKDEGRLLGEQIGRHLTLERSQLAGFL